MKLILNSILSNQIYLRNLASYYEYSLYGAKQIINHHNIMNIKNQLNEKADYVSPKCKAAAVKSSRVMCQSPIGPNSIKPWIEDEEDLLEC